MAEDTTNINDDQEKPIVQKAEELAQRIEEANKKAEEILKRQEYLATKNLLGGRSTAGTTEIKKDPDEEERNKINEWLKPFGKKI